MQHEGETWYVCKTKHGGDLTIKFCPQGGGVDILNCQIPTTSPPAATLGGWGVSLIPALGGRYLMPYIADTTMGYS